MKCFFSIYYKSNLKSFIKSIYITKAVKNQFNRKKHYSTLKVECFYLELILKRFKSIHKSNVLNNTLNKPL